MAEADSDTGGSLQLEAKEALLPRSERIREAVCGQNGLLAWACLSTFLVFVFGVILVFLAFGEKPLAASNCLYALGGGEVVDGSFPDPRILSAQCRTELRAYIAGPYLKDVKIAANAAADYFDSVENVSRSQVVVFDIDETTLSNLPEWQEYQLAGMIEDDSARRAWQAAGNAPALMPSRSLFNALYHQGFTITFLTGRHDTGDNRQSTASNLQAAGYGSQCIDPNITESQPCYLQLDMRDPDDTRLASVYKPDKRAQLTARGYVIAGSLGDQWSDLAGPSPAIASFKLPNPMYYIL
ncbi:hypothetical protein WJX79_004860 [Trebouxia sp. C0005]